MSYMRNNVGTKFSGERNTFKISNTVGCKLQASDSNLSICNCTFTKLDGERNIIDLRNCTNDSINGSDNNITQNNTTNATVKGDHNKVSMRNVTNFGLTGSQNVCELNNDTNAQISGNDNGTNGKSNTNLSVLGNGNTVEAENNTNLRIKANQSKVVAYQSCNTTVNGEQNDVAVHNTGLTHSLMRDLSGSANRVRFTGVRSQVFQGNIQVSNCIVNGTSISISSTGIFNIIGNMFGASTGPTQPNQVEIPNAEKWRSQGEIYVPMYASVNNFATATDVFRPQLDVSYVERMTVNQKDYAVGIFHFNLEYLGKESDQGYTSFLGIEVDLSKLDKSSFESVVKEKVATLEGKKDGILQKLLLEGPRVMTCDKENQFIVNLNP